MVTAAPELNHGSDAAARVHPSRTPGSRTAAIDAVDDNWWCERKKTSKMLIKNGLIKIWRSMSQDEQGDEMT